MNYDPVAICIVLTVQFLNKNPITFQFLLIVFNGLWKPFQLFIIHFFSAPTAEQNVYFFPALYGFSPCFDCCEAVFNWAFSPLLFTCYFGRKMPVWAQQRGWAAVRGHGRTLHLPYAFRIISSSLPLLSDTPFTTAGPWASSSSPCIQKLCSPTAGLMCDPLLLLRWVTFRVLPKGSWKQDLK